MTDTRTIRQGDTYPPLIFDEGGFVSAYLIRGDWVYPLEVVDSDAGVVALRSDLPAGRGYLNVVWSDGRHQTSDTEIQIVPKEPEPRKMVIELEIPDDIDTATLNAVTASLTDAAAGHVDWEALHLGSDSAISPAGKVLLDLQHQLRCECSGQPRIYARQRVSC